MATRSYGQHCAVAKSLDIVGDRWTLLIVRDLLDGPQRYGDLLAGLRPIATDVLAGRLRQLEQHGLVRRRELPRPASGNVYELTDDGAALEGVVHAFARWGRSLLHTRRPGDSVRPRWLVRAVRAYVRPDRTGSPVSVRLVTPDGAAAVRITADTVEDLDDDAPVDVTLTGDVEVLAAALDPANVPPLLDSGRLRLDGTEHAVQRLAKAFAPRLV
ncbi:winged helix-turn-helix transcriptional regulator [Mycolicibacterium thermoresistibile]